MRKASTGTTIAAATAFTTLSLSACGSSPPQDYYANGRAYAIKSLSARDGRAPRFTARHLCTADLDMFAAGGHNTVGDSLGIRTTAGPTARQWITGCIAGAEKVARFVPVDVGLYNVKKLENAVISRWNSDHPDSTRDATAHAACAPIHVLGGTSRCLLTADGAVWRTTVTVTTDGADWSGTTWRQTGAGTAGSSPPAHSASTPAAQTVSQQIAASWKAFSSAKTPLAQRVSLLQDGSAFTAILRAQADSALAAQAIAQVTEVTMTSSMSADVTYSILVGSKPELTNQKGTAVLSNGTWQVSANSFCGLVAMQSGGETSRLPAACQN